jgi:hypothetical protein
MIHEGRIKFAFYFQVSVQLIKFSVKRIFITMPCKPFYHNIINGAYVKIRMQSFAKIKSLAAVVYRFETIFQFVRNFNKKSGSRLDAIFCIRKQRKRRFHLCFINRSVLQIPI